MATERELWEGYFYSETYDPSTMKGTLRNRLDERDPVVLEKKEYTRTSERQRELMGGEVAVPRTYDAEHVRALHRHLFQDVYDWAGEFRTVPLYKGTPRGFAGADGGEIDRYLVDVKKLVEATPWATLGRDEFAERAAMVFAHLNQAHPFREGNGRTSKVFMEHVAEQSAFTLSYDRVTPEVWNEASKWSGPDRFSYEPHPAELVAVFKAIAVNRSTQQPPSTSASDPSRDTQRDRSGHRASFPRPATEATRPGISAVPINRPPRTPGRRPDVGRD
jgi:cell filamentation protein